MKKILIFIILIISFVSDSKSQEFCGRTGLNLSKHISDASESSFIKPGFNLGFVVDINIVQELYFRPGLMFTIKGAKYKDVNKQINHQHYGEIPLLMAYQIKITKDIKLDFQTGPFVAYGICGHIIYKGGPNEGFSQLSFQRKENGVKNQEFRRFDFGLNYGAGLVYKAFYLGVSYDRSFIKLKDYMVWEQKNGVLMINIGYYLRK
ncbi:MAG: PorT family protein [Bacteroidales bacterium]|nr:PorT family protein [Bacteroidales bacterium]